MTEPRITTRTHSYRLAAAILASTVLAAPVLACQNPSVAGSKMSWSRSADLPAMAPAEIENLTPAAYSLATSDGSSTVVGMWHAILRLGDANGPVFDEVLEHFHSDGTELLISNGLPPALGNVCIGIWKRTATRTYKLKHMTWNWSSDQGGFGVPGTFAGHFELEVTLRLDARGNAFTGRWTAQNFGLDGEHLPELDAEGVVTGVRIDVN